LCVAWGIIASLSNYLKANTWIVKYGIIVDWCLIVPHYIHVCNGSKFRARVVAQGHCLNSSLRWSYIGGIPIAVLGGTTITILCGITYMASIIYRINHDAINLDSMLHITKDVNGFTIFIVSICWPQWIKTQYSSRYDGW
jgi:hypothetical protein